MQESQKYYKKGTHVSKACAKQLASWITCEKMNKTEETQL